jgi:hypothetical protein
MKENLTEILLQMREKSKRNITTKSLFHLLLRMATYTGNDSVYVKGHVVTGILN